MSLMLKRLLNPDDFKMKILTELEDHRKTIPFTINQFRHRRFIIKNLKAILNDLKECE